MWNSVNVSTVFKVISLLLSTLILHWKILTNQTFFPLLELFIVLHQNKEARRKSKNCYTGFGSCNVQNAFVCARMHFQVWHPIRIVELMYVVLHKPSFLLMLLIFQRSLGKKKQNKPTIQQNKMKRQDKCRSRQLDWHKEFTLKAFWCFHAWVSKTSKLLPVCCYASCKHSPKWTAISLKFCKCFSLVTS